MKKFLFTLTLVLVGFLGFSQNRYISEMTKKIVYTRDGGTCKCCGSSVRLEYDHIIPYSCGGGSDVSNIQLLCRKCNRSKSNGCYCKIHDKKVGNNCCDGQKSVKKSKKSYNSYKDQSSVSNQCSGITKKGKRCRNKTTNSSGRCYLHQ